MALHFNITLLSLPFLLWISVQTRAQTPETAQSFWEKGVEAKDNGEYGRALSLWKSAMEESTTADPRIGFSYIDLVTGQKLKKYYRDASAMYSRGLTGCAAGFKDELEEEIERIEPIADRKTYKQWRQLLKENPAEACEQLADFWEKTDPTATTPYNERLIEHWERIAYAREHFNRSRSSVYEADERAPIYVKLGAPDHISKGMLHFNSPLVRSWVQDGIELHTSANASGSPLSSFGGSGDSAAGENRRQQFVLERVTKDIMASNITKNARLLHRYPYYEIWVYRELLPETRENVIYIFGEDGDTGEFRMLRSLEDMIPSSAFRSYRTNGTSISPGLLLQMLFYEQTSIADNYFADAYNELQSNLFSLNNFNSRISFSLRSRKASQLRFLQFKAPQEQSTYLEEMPGIDILVHQYRMLDKNNRPYLATFVESQPQKAFFIDQLKQEVFDGSSYQLYHYSRVTDEANHTLDRQSEHAPIYYTGTGHVEEMQKSASYFKISHTSENSRQVFSAELHNRKTNSSVLGEDVFPEHIRAIGQLETEQPEPLSVSPDELEVCDLLIGIAGQPENRPTVGPAPFRVLHNRMIPANKNMMVHFEVYHLSDGGTAPNRFEVEYQVDRKERNVFQRLFGGSGEKVKLTLNFEAVESFYASDLEVDTSPFEPGAYELSLKITEPLTGRTAERKVDFEIREE